MDCFLLVPRSRNDGALSTFHSQLSTKKERETAFFYMFILRTLRILPMFDAEWIISNTSIWLLVMR
jgi:hypothetical protein